MTRDEATKIMSIPAAFDTVGPEIWIQCFVALGMLKLDEPKDMPQKLRDFLSDTRLVQGDVLERLGKLQAVLRDCGLKIVEK